MQTKDDKAYATLTDVKNKTGDVFALADEFGEVTITSYNKAKYVIKRLLRTHTVDTEVEIDELAAAESDIAPTVEETQAAVASEIEQTPVIPVADMSSVTAELTAVSNLAPEAADAASDLDVANIAETVATEVVPALPTGAALPGLPEHEVALVDQPELQSTEAEVAVPDLPAPQVPQPEPEVPVVPPIEIIASTTETVVQPLINTPDSLPLKQENDIVGIFSGVGSDSVWDRSSRLEQNWIREAHKSL